MGADEWIWGGGLAAALAYFTFFEARAASRDTVKSGTLTAFVRRLVGTDTRPVRGRAKVLGLLYLGFVTWFGGHVFLGWWP